MGEPIIVTYKLYSAMASESSIVRRPSFDGFEVKDLKAGSDGLASRETIDGVGFDVHTVLKLQLTPYKDGRLSLGTLTMRNRVRLVNANGKKDPILNGVNEGYSLDNGYFNLSVTSVPIPIIVTALPGNTTPSTKFDGLVGDFKMDVQLAEKVLAPGKAAALTITITGKGDFSKIKQPEVQWPDEVDVLPAKVDEDKTQSADGSGYKSFEIPFTVNDPGKYTIPSIKFAFFDAVNYKYKTITNIPIEFSVVQEGGTNASVTATNGNEENKNFIVLSILVLVVLIIAIWLTFRNRKKKQPHSTQKAQKNLGIQKIEPLAAMTVEDILKPAADALHHSGNSFSTQLKQAVIRFFEQRLVLPPGSFNQTMISSYLSESNIPVQKHDAILSLFNELDMAIYSGGIAEADRQTLLNKTRSLLMRL
ncbi:BatD family protein [Niabella ginsengisoli]|uniref:BatD family protein n=1 Tax=Niabella ginsengisoli TaxID=522298 RepID=A0ABS9SNZ6_9BACT|nr:BatD family protein [Niabella ginsengisoli]MCH5600091.1 BatD family protein [Niabella ginsengisoli]